MGCMMMEHGNSRENQASNLKKILADINAQERARESLLNDDDFDVKSKVEPRLYNENEYQNQKETVSMKEDDSSDLLNLNESEQIDLMETKTVDLNEIAQKVSNENEEISNSDDEKMYSNNDNNSLETITTLNSEKHDYVPYGHYEEVTSNSEDIVYYDSEQFQQYVQRQKKTQKEIDEEASQGKINKEILEHNALIDGQYVDGNIQESSIGEDEENNIVQFTEQEINTLNLPPRREVHRKTSRKITFQVTKPLFRFSLLVILTSISIIYLFLIGTDELVQLFELRAIFNWF